MANRGGNSRRAHQEEDNAITSVQCDGLVSFKLFLAKIFIQIHKIPLVNSNKTLYILKKFYAMLLSSLNSIDIYNLQKKKCLTLALSIDVFFFTKNCLCFHVYELYIHMYLYVFYFNFYRLL